jgi:hypothetical protein
LYDVLGVEAAAQGRKGVSLHQGAEAMSVAGVKPGRRILAALLELMQQLPVGQFGCGV